MLTFSFDFELLEAPLGAEAYATPSPWLPAFVVPGATTLVVGRDAMGGVYLHCEFAPAAPTRWLHLDTCGHVTCLGETLQEVLALIVALPYWHQLLLECPSLALESMRRVAAELEREVCEDLPFLPAAREDLKHFLELAELGDPVRHFHELALSRAAAVTVLSPHGWRYESPLARAEAHPAL